jgi:hypothetical protein
MTGKSGNCTRLASASSYSSICQSPTPFSPTSRMKASACAISSASALDQKTPAQARGREEHTSVGILALKRRLETLGQRPIGRMVAEKQVPH